MQNMCFAPKSGIPVSILARPPKSATSNLARVSNQFSAVRHRWELFKWVERKKNIGRGVRRHSIWHLYNNAILSYRTSHISSKVCLTGTRFSRHHYVARQAVTNTPLSFGIRRRTKPIWWKEQVVSCVHWMSCAVVQLTHRAGNFFLSFLHDNIEGVVRMIHSTIPPPSQKKQRFSWTSVSWLLDTRNDATQTKKKKYKINV